MKGRNKMQKEEVLKLDYIKISDEYNNEKGEN